MTNAAKRLALLEQSRVRAPVEKFFPEAERECAYVSTTPWPKLAGCVGILCTSRSGSTLLCREIERRFAVGEVGESLNLPILKIRAERKGIISPGDALRYVVSLLMESGWFAYKGGLAALDVAERSGFLAEYIDKSRFLFLLRRDVVAQAVSLIKAEMTSRYHFRQRELRHVSESDYSSEEIFKKIKQILRGVRILHMYLASVGRPFEIVFYESFQSGDVDAIERSCDALGMPRRREVSSDPSRMVHRIADSINLNWSKRFRTEADASAQRTIDEYEEFLAVLR